MTRINAKYASGQCQHWTPLGASETCYPVGMNLRDRDELIEDLTNELDALRLEITEREQRVRMIRLKLSALKGAGDD